METRGVDQLLATGGTLTLVHFTHLAGDEWRIACMPSMTEFHSTPHHPNYQRSDDVRAVTCPACKKSTTFVVAKSALDAVLRAK